jgi:hypothetical protein
MFSQTGFNVANGVIAKVTCKATTKTRETSLNCYLETLEISIDKIKRVISIGLNNFSIGDYFVDGVSWSAYGANNGLRW